MQTGTSGVSPEVPATGLTSRRRWIAAVAAGVIVLGGLGLIAVVGDESPSPNVPTDSPAPDPVATTSTEPVSTSTVPTRTAVDADHRSYFSVDDALEYRLDPDRPLRDTFDELQASRVELALVLAGRLDRDRDGQVVADVPPLSELPRRPPGSSPSAPEGTTTDVAPNLFFILNSDDQSPGDALRTQAIFSPRRSAKCYYTMGGVHDLDGGGGYPPGLTGAFEMIGDGGDMRADWIYVQWYDDDLTYDEATAQLDEAVLGWILSRWHVFDRGYSGSKIAVTLSPEPTAPWNQAVLDHPFVHPAVVAEDLVDAVCDTFVPMEPL